MNRKFKIIGLLLAAGTAGLLLSGCGTQVTSNNNSVQPSTDTAASGPAACSLFTPSDAEQILKATVTPAPDQSANTCTYSTINTDTGSFGIATMVISTSTPTGARTTFETAKAVTYENKTEAVTIPGADDAYWATTLNQLSVLKGSSWIIVSVISGDAGSNDQTNSIEAAKLILAKF
jgi:hypothetical protein